MAINIIMLNQIIHGDCFEVLKDIPDNSINLICTDPPYFKVKKDNWDRQWDKPEHFLEWIDKAAEHWQRVLKPNGSIYCFASPKMAARVEVKLAERFNILNNIVWNKLQEYDPGDARATAYKARDHKSFRSFFNYSERIILCEHYPSKPKGIGGILKQQREVSSFLANELATLFPSLSGGLTGVISNWELGKSTPSKNQWDKLSSKINLPSYEDTCRPFNVTADVPYTDVWTFPTVSAYKGKHPCEKPLELIKHIIKSSSREGDLVLDPFCGSGTTAVACKELGRNYICIEKEKEYFDIACDRISQPREYSETELETMELKQPEFKQLSLFDVA